MAHGARLDLRAQGDAELASLLLADHDLARALKELEQHAEEAGARRQLLATAVRMTPQMAPDLHAILDRCRGALGIETPFEAYVYPGPVFNAGAVRPERGRLFLLFSSSLLEAFDPDELAFVVGHELGHHLFEHHRIPVTALLSSPLTLDPALALRLFAWQRYAEVSCDRTGLFCAGRLEAAARALFKLASGLRGDRVGVSIDAFLSQVTDLEAEEARLACADAPVRSDWFATHPFSPLRLRAADLFASSELVCPGGIPRAELEAQVAEVMKLMEPNYLTEHSDTAEVMRRLLFAGGLLIASASGELDEREVVALERLLGEGSLPPQHDPLTLRADLARRIQDVRTRVPPLRRAQILRDLCVVASADGEVTDAEVKVLFEIADGIAVDRSLVTCAVPRVAPHH